MIIVTVIPLMALERFGNSQDVSVFFFLLGIPGVGMSLAVPWLVSRYTLRETLSLGAVTGVMVNFFHLHTRLQASQLFNRYSLPKLVCLRIPP